MLVHGAEERNDFKKAMVLGGHWLKMKQEFLEIKEKKEEEKNASENDQKIQARK